MNEPLEISYFNWLCAKVLDNNTRIYESLMEILFRTEFILVIPADKHRISDGLELREIFLRKVRSSIMFDNPCSVLEVLIAFSNRAEFQTSISARNWFWEFLHNLNLDQFSVISESDVPLIEDVLHTFTWRIYEPDGRGGLFPMEQTRNDQRQIEIWYQFNEYLDYRGL